MQISPSKVHSQTAKRRAWGCFKKRGKRTLATNQLSYFQQDHLGSISVITDEVGVIHMNGRVYDPLMGRFMSADPFIQAPFELQSHNRYAYVMNNPLYYTDPSGYSWLGSVFQGVTGSSWSSVRDNVVKPVVVVAVAYYAGGLAANAMGYGGATYGAAMTAATSGGLTSAVAVGAASGFAAGFTATTLYGGNLDQAFQTGTTGALVGGAMGGVGFASSGMDVAGRVATKVVASGALAKAQGGSFADAVRRTLLTSTAAEVYTRFTGFTPTAEGGENRTSIGLACGEAGSNCYIKDPVTGKIPSDYEGVNTITRNEALTASDGSLSDKQGALISRILNVAPVMNAMSKLHDTFFLSGGFGWDSKSNILNYGSMVPAYAFSYASVIDRLPAVDRSRCPKCFR